MTSCVGSVLDKLSSLLVVVVVVVVVVLLALLLLLESIVALTVSRFGQALAVCCLTQWTIQASCHMTCIILLLSMSVRPRAVHICAKSLQPQRQSSASWVGVAILNPGEQIRITAQQEMTEFSGFCHLTDLSSIWSQIPMYS